MLVPGTGCKRKDALPDPSSAQYAKFVSAFYTGLAGLQVGDDVRAESGLAEAARLAPGEPAAWVNWGVLALRQRNYDAAAERLGRARTLAPGNDQVEYLLGLLEGERGNTAAAITDLESSVQSNPRNLRATYQLASEIERQGDTSSDERFERLMQQILQSDPGNLAAELELSRVAAKRGDTATLRATVDHITLGGGDWPPEVKQQLAQLRSAAAGPEPRSAATRSIFLRNVLMRVPAFRDSLSTLRPQPGEGAQPMLHFLRLANPSSRPAPADTGLHFTVQPVANMQGSAPWNWAGAISLGGDGAPILAAANGRELQLASGATLVFPGGERADLEPSPEGVLPIDFNYDFKTDLVLAGSGGVRLFRQDNPSHFTDVSSTTKLPLSVLQASYTGAWAVDIEADGDLDILLGSASGVPTLLRNNGDGTFAVEHPFTGISGAKQVVWVDVNGDGNPDAAVLDGADRLHIFLNRRSGSFTETAVSSELGPIKAITAADLGSEGVLSLVAVERSGSIIRLTSPDDGRHWNTSEIARVPGDTMLGDNSSLHRELRLIAADLDNNGAVDLVLMPVWEARPPGTTGMQPEGAQIFLGTENGSFTRLPLQATGLSHIDGLADLAANGHLALIGFDHSGALSTANAELAKNYHWQTIRPRARQATGDQRINSFGIGGEIEIRSGLLVQKQPITSPQLHFGLGEQKQTDVARILWPNGSVRAEFGLKADQQIVTEQRLKGSCPFLFAWDGHRMSFVKDSVPWGSAIGLRINALGAAKIAATEEWYKIGRDQLVPRDGFYDLRVTGELWETYYYDSLTLTTVDHPAGTEVFTDERFDVPPVKLAVTTVGEPQPIARAVDDNGRDVTATVRQLDGNYLDTFGRGQYQGITRDHFVEIELPETADIQQPLWLIARGWLHPSDSSVNVALGQGSGEKPKWLSLEVPDGRGGWRVSRPNLGFPAGRNKICLMDLGGVFPPGLPHRLRLRTNLEVFWDQIEWAQGRPETPLRTQRLSPVVADLHYRGFSEIHQANISSPEIPDYDHIAGTAQRWRDLEGYYTRFGDVRELLANTDDRYVIMNAGDELSLHFAVPPPPPPGWLRDFVIAGDGWIKDGDYNSTHSQTVLPYPYHARRDYDSAPGALESDWVYKHHARDWQVYHTRYVARDHLQNALRSRAGQ